jgi:hypothetical protein
MRGGKAVAEQVHHAEAPRVVEGDGYAVRKCEHDMIVTIADEVTGQSPALCIAADPQRSGHPEVHQQRLAGVERNQQVLAAAIDRADPATFESRRKSRRERAAQILASEQHVLDPRTAHRRFEPAADRLDLR